MPSLTQVNFADQTQKILELLTAATAVTVGHWQRMEGIRPFSVTISGSFSASVIVRVANQKAAPDDTDNNWPQLDTTVSAPTAITVDVGYMWIKAQIPSYSSGVVSCHALLG